MMNRGFDRSAMALSAMVKCPVNCIDSKVMASLSDLSLGRKAEAAIVLTTEIIGDLSGKSYLVLTEADREKICHAVSPNSKLNDQLQEALLLEIDNIVSAMVISQIADELEVEGFGDVPQIHYIRSNEVLPMMSSGTEENQANCMLSATTFSIAGLDAQLRFMWKLSIKDLSKSKSIVKP